MKYYLLNYSEDWADEFDLFANEIMTEEDYNTYIDSLPEEITVYANLSNVNAENEHSKKEFIECISKQELTKKEYDILNKFNVCNGICNAFDIY